MRLFFRHFLLHPALLLAVSALLLTVSVRFLSLHAEAVSTMRQTGLPAALALQQIETRATVLREQNEAAELQAALRTGTEEEILRISVLPDEPAPDRLLATFDVVFTYLQDRSLLREYPVVTIGEPIDHSDEASAWIGYPVRFSVTATQEGMEMLSSFLRIAGMLTVSDLLSPSDIDRLLMLTEDQNPAAITALEQFLSADLLRFAETPRPYQDQLLGSLSSPLFAEELSTMLDVPARRNGLSLLRELAPTLRERSLWPVRFLSPREARMEGAGDPWLTAMLMVEAAGRVQE